MTTTNETATVDAGENEKTLSAGDGDAVATVAPKAKKEKKPKPERTDAVAVKLKEKRNVFGVAPESLVIVRDEAHPLYDERVHYKRNESKVAWSFENGAKGKVILGVREAKGGPIVLIDGRQTTLDVIEANKQRVKAKLEPHAVDVQVITVSDMNEAADLMEIHNSFITEDGPLTLCRKLWRRHDRLGALLKDKETGEPLYTEKQLIESSATVFNVSPQTIRMRLTARKAIQPAQDACEAGKIGFVDLVEIAKSATPEVQLARLKEFMDARQGRGDDDSDEEGDDEDEGSESDSSEPKERKRKPKGMGPKALKRIADDAPVSAEIQSFCRYLIGEIGARKLAKEIPGLKGYLPGQKAPKGNKEDGEEE